MTHEQRVSHPGLEVIERAFCCGVASTSTACFRAGRGHVEHLL